MQYAIEKRCEFDYGFGAHYKCMWHRTEGNHQVVIDTSNLMNSNRIIVYFFFIQEMNMANGFKWKQQHRFYVEFFFSILSTSVGMWGICFVFNPNVLLFDAIEKIKIMAQLNFNLEIYIGMHMHSETKIA